MIIFLHSAINLSGCEFCKNHLRIRTAQLSQLTWWPTLEDRKVKRPILVRSFRFCLVLVSGSGLGSCSGSWPGFRIRPLDPEPEFLGHQNPDFVFPVDADQDERDAENDDQAEKVGELVTHFVPGVGVAVDVAAVVVVVASHL